MRTLAVDATNGIYLDGTRSLAIAAGVDAVASVIGRAVKAQLGEMVYAADSGIPYRSTIFTSASAIEIFEGYLRATIAGVNNVTGIQSLTVSQSGAVFSYTALVNTTYGAVTVNG